VRWRKSPPGSLAAPERSRHLYSHRFRILLQCVHDLIVAPQIEEHQFLGWPLLPGRVYPAVYVTRQQFDNVRLPPNSRRFVIIRDLRDTLISAYFSYKVSHTLLSPQMAYFRKVLTECDFEEGLMYLMDEIMQGYALIQI
jgi:lipopolysaccharide transport system ATP-binding protein